MSAANYNVDYKKNLWIRLLDNLPTGYTESQVVNLDLDSPKKQPGNYIQQSTTTVLRALTAPGGRCFRTTFLHTIGIYVNKDSRSDKMQMQTTIQEILTAFESKEFECIRTQEVEIDEAGNEPNTNLYRIDLNVNGYFEDN